MNACKMLAKPGQNAVINLVGLQFSDRPAFFMTLFAQIRDLRTRTGHPHWLIVDEAHHVLPADWKPAEVNLPVELTWVFMISVSPQRCVNDRRQTGRHRDRHR
jgi:hypothetical protein